MKQHDWLFPHVFRKAGWLIVMPLFLFFLVLRSEVGQEHFNKTQIWPDHQDTVTNILSLVSRLG
jgi:hypothetical protein